MGEGTAASRFLQVRRRAIMRCTWLKHSAFGFLLSAAIIGVPLTRAHADMGSDMAACRACLEHWDETVKAHAAINGTVAAALTALGALVTSGVDIPVVAACSVAAGTVGASASAVNDVIAESGCNQLAACQSVDEFIRKLDAKRRQQSCQ
jgi:hypothetical protein